MIDRAYLEITNICNLDCLFCPKNGRPKTRLTSVQFDRLTDRLRGNIRFLYFHLMGEPMLHPELPRFITLAREKGFIPILTTNGTLFRPGQPGQRTDVEALLAARPHKYQISLHSQEGNGIVDLKSYIAEVMTFSMRAAQEGSIVVLRLWNQGGYDRQNEQILEHLSAFVPRPWTERYDGYKLGERLYLEFDHLFEWPDEQHEEYPTEEVFCYALRNQIGILVDGTIVPCCLDHDASIPLGNLFQQSLDDILSSPRAKALYEGFSHHTATEEFCRKCGYASVTKRFRK